MSGAGDMSSSHSKDMLIGFIRRVRDIRQQVRDLNADKAEIKKEARAAGFDSTKIEEVSAWMDKVEKHGAEAMDEAEAIFDLYRDVATGGAKDFDDMMEDARDRALLKIFAPEDQTEKKITAASKKMKTSLALAQGANLARKL